jgi:LysM repeat protein
MLLLVLTSNVHAQHTQSSPTHTIQPGETLSQIAERYDIPLDELMELNSITDPDAIFFGQILVLPVAANATPVPVVVDPAYRPDERVPIEHVVLPGESLSMIAEQYGLTLETLMEYNGITDPDTIVIGTALRLTPALATEAAQPNAPAPAPVNSGNPIASLNQTYTVQAGDSVPYIALRFGVDEDALRWLNNLDDETTLELGQPLILPATAQELIAQRKPGELTAKEIETEEADTQKIDTQESESGAESPDKSSLYIVQPGDSLGRIAQDHGLSLAEIMGTNQIASPDAIYVGQELVLPTHAAFDEKSQIASIESTPKSTENTKKQTLPQAIGRPRSGFFYYTVKPGDNLSELAREFDSTQLALLEYNDLPNIETVYAGLELRIPYGPPPLPLTLPPIPFSGTRFVVSLSRQQCWVLQANTVRYTWRCSTGYGEWITRTGNFAVQSKIEMAKSTAYALDMPYWLGIYDVGTYENGIHGLPIRWDTGEKIWEGLIGQPATFGCAMLDDEDAKTLYNMAFLGMPVHIVP